MKQVTTWIRARNAASTATLAALAIMAPAAAMAHPGHSTATFMGGMHHPVSGMDHLLVMVAVGLWAVQLSFTGRRAAVWQVPLSFVMMLLVGAGIGMGGFPIPFVEEGILTSVLLIGALVTASVTLPTSASVALVGLFALFHGVAHGAEMPAGGSALAYMFGFALSTALLHGLGIGAGLLSSLLGQRAALALRLAGACVLTGGLYLALQ